MKYFISAFLALSALALTAAVAEPPPPDLLKAAEAEQPAFMKTWETLVNIDSGSQDIHGLSKVEALLAWRLKELGARVEVIPASRPAKADGQPRLTSARLFGCPPTDETPPVANSVVATLNGSGSKRIMLMIHYDTVFLEGDAAKRPFRVDAKRAYGPGVADAKGGVAIILHALKILKDQKFDGYGTLTILFNPDEEQSSIGSRTLIRKLAADQDYVLSFEPPEKEAVMVATNGIAWLHLKVEGKAAHAGSAPEEGRNAAIELAHQLLQLDHLGDSAKRTTANWTITRAGCKENIIPDLALATADIRFSDAGEIERVRLQAEGIVKTSLVRDTTVRVEIEERRPPFATNPASEKLAATANRIYGEIGRSVEAVPFRAGTDAGFVYDPNDGRRVVLEGLGIVGAEIHTEKEFAELDSVVPRLYLAVRMIEVLSGAPSAGSR